MFVSDMIIFRNGYFFFVPCNTKEK